MAWQTKRGWQRMFISARRSTGGPQFSALQKEVETAVPRDGVDRVTISRQLLHRLISVALRQKAEFDDGYYLATHPDIRIAVEAGRIIDVAGHYFETGYFENRQPRRFTIDEKYYLRENPDVSEAMRQADVASPQAHFDEVGFREGRLPFAGFALF